MRFFRVVLLVFLGLGIFVLPAFGAFEDTDGAVLRDETFMQSFDDYSRSEDYELVDVSVRAVNPISPSGSVSIKNSLLSIIGDYDAVVVEYQYQSSQGYYSYLREVQPDYAWLCSAAFLLVFVFCLFRLGGALICRR